MTMTTRYAPLARSSATAARSWVGRDWPPGWCLAWLLRHAYGLPADIESAAGLLEQARAADVLLPLNPPEDIPAGALVVWGGEPGHVAYSLGGGRIVTTDLPESGRVGEADVADVAAAWGYELAGYLLAMPSGVELTREPVPVVQAFLSDDSRPQASPDTDADHAAPLVPAGTPVTVLEQAGGYSRTAAGWYLDEALSDTDPTGRHRLVHEAGATTRQVPSRDAGPVALLQPGDVVCVLEQRTIERVSWLRVSGGVWLEASEVRKA